MSQRQLQSYLDQQNLWRTHENKAPLEIHTLTVVQAQTLMESLECNLSPENLSCDGELSRAQVNARFRLYTGAIQGLNTIFPQVTLRCDEWNILA